MQLFLFFSFLLFPLKLGWNAGESGCLTDWLTLWLTNWLPVLSSPFCLNDKWWCVLSRKNTRKSRWMRCGCGGSQKRANNKHLTPFFVIPHQKHCNFFVWINGNLLKFWLKWIYVLFLFQLDFEYFAWRFGRRLLQSVRQACSQSVITVRLAGPSARSSGTVKV